MDFKKNLWARKCCMYSTIINHNPFFAWKGGVWFTENFPPSVSKEIVPPPLSPPWHPGSPPPFFFLIPQRKRLYKTVKGFSLGWNYICCGFNSSYLTLELKICYVLILLCRDMYNTQLKKSSDIFIFSMRWHRGQSPRELPKVTQDDGKNETSNTQVDVAPPSTVEVVWTFQK